jgi:hypothetical protein
MQGTIPQLEAGRVFPYNTRADLKFSTTMMTLYDCTYAATSVAWHVVSGCPGALRPTLAPGYFCQGI